MWDLNTIRRLNDEATAPRYDSARRTYETTTADGTRVRVPIPKVIHLPEGVTIVRHS